MSEKLQLPSLVMQFDKKVLQQDRNWVSAGFSYFKFDFLTLLLQLLRITINYNSSQSMAA
jgi:hypothetical protein